MARALRIQYPGAQYHIMSRGNGGQSVFLENSDYELFLRIFKETIEKNNWVSCAFCIMPNHYHLFIETIDPNLSIGMRQLNGDFTQKYNLKNKRRGHLFQGRFKSVLVDGLQYAGELIRYIILNPVRAGLCNNVEDWKWSSHNELINAPKQSGCVDKKRVLSFFHSNEREARKIYKKFIEEKISREKVWNDFRRGAIVGSKNFVKHVTEKYCNNKSFEIIKKERFLGRPQLKNIFKEVKTKKERNKQIYKSVKLYGYSCAEVGRYLGLHYASVSRLIKREK